jgi:hypothetical protein
MEILRGLKNNIITNGFKLQEYWLIESQLDFVLQIPELKRIAIKKGVNRINIKKYTIKEGNLIPITIKIYGTELLMF